MRTAATIAPLTTALLPAPVGATRGRSRPGGSRRRRTASPREIEAIHERHGTPIVDAEPASSRTGRCPGAQGHAAPADLVGWKVERNSWLVARVGRFLSRLSSSSLTS